MWRVPFGGRNYEYLPGEDAVLGAELATAMIEVIQDANIGSGKD